jgi:hypothetical protein
MRLQKKSVAKIFDAAKLNSARPVAETDINSDLVPKMI